MNKQQQLQARARKTAKELRDASRDLEKAIVQDDFSKIEEILDEFESNDETQAA
jgi:hypothetical protein